MMYLKINTHIRHELRLRRRAQRDERGASLVEYALLIVLIALVCIVAIAFFGTETSRSFNSTANSIAGI